MQQMKQIEWNAYNFSLRIPLEHAIHKIYIAQRPYKTKGEYGHTWSDAHIHENTHESVAVRINYIWVNCKLLGGLK